MEMVEFAKDMTPMELLALSSRMRDSSRVEGDVNDTRVDSGTKLSGASNVSRLDRNDDPATHSDRIGTGGRISTRGQVPEHHDHESAADLVNLLDESLDFIRDSSSREGDGNQAKPSSGGDDNSDENNAKEAASDSRSSSAKSAAAGDSPPDRLKPKDGGEPRTETPELQDEEAEGGDNQSDYEDDSMDGNDRSNSEPDAPQSVSELPETADVASDDGDAEHSDNNSLAEGVSPEPLDPETMNNSSDPPDHNKQSSSRSNASDNHSEYDNSFDGEAGDAEVDREADTAPSDAVELAVRAEPQEPATRDEAPLTGDNKEDDTSEPTELPASPDKALSCRTEENNPSDYENSFDDEGDDANEEKGNEELEPDAASPTADSATEAVASTVNSNVPPIRGMQQGKHVIEPEREEAVPEAEHPQTISKRLVTELKRWTFLEDENRPTEVNALASLAWCDSRTLTEALQSHSPISECIEGSIISMLEQYGLAVPESPLASLLNSEVAQELDLARHLVDECHAVVGDVCSTVADAMQRSIQQKNSLVSEMDISEVLEVAESVRQEYHDTAWEYLKIASTLLVF